LFEEKARKIGCRREKTGSIEIIKGKSKELSSAQRVDQTTERDRGEEQERERRRRREGGRRRRRRSERKRLRVAFYAKIWEKSSNTQTATNKYCALISPVVVAIVVAQRSEMSLGTRSYTRIKICALYRRVGSVEGVQHRLRTAQHIHHQSAIASMGCCLS
jgi:hypothetical protein